MFFNHTVHGIQYTCIQGITVRTCLLILVKKITLAVGEWFPDTNVYYRSNFWDVLSCPPPPLDGAPETLIL